MQYVHIPISTIILKCYKIPFPALNVHRRKEAIATDTVYTNTLAVNNASTCSEIFIGIKSLVADVFGMKTDKQFVNTLEEIIW